MSKLIYLGYNKRSCVTGKQLFDELKSIAPSDISFRRFCRGEPSRTPTHVIRWGNSLVDVPREVIEINRQEAVRNTSDKLEMIKILQAADGVRIPDVAYASDTETLTSASSRVSDVSGELFVRDSNDHVRLTNVSGVRSTDKYALKVVNKVREFRVHVFNGETIGVYEKIPHNSNDPIWKNDNTDFKRLDQASSRQMKPLKGMRPMCKAAVDALGLVFGGVDVLLSSQGKFYVNEVNSSPALNEPNIKRWSTHLINYIQNLPNSETDDDQSRQSTIEHEEAIMLASEERRRQLEAARRAAAEDVKRRMRDIAEAEGFSARINLTDNQM